MSVLDYISVGTYIEGKSEPARALAELTSLGIQGKIDFFIPLENVCVIWYAVFGERKEYKDPCGYYLTKGREYFKITTESLETLAASKGRKGSHAMQLDTPVEMRVNYANFNPDVNSDDYQYISELRGVSHHSDPTSTRLSIEEACKNFKEGRKDWMKARKDWIDKERENLTKTDDVEWEKLDDDKLERMSIEEVCKIFKEQRKKHIEAEERENLTKTEAPGGNLGGNPDNVEWEDIDDVKLAELLNHDISELFLLRKQVEPPSSDNQSEDSYSDLVVAVGWKKKGKNKNGLMSIEDATRMSEGTVRKYADMIDPDFLKNRVRKTSSGKEAIHLTQFDVNSILAAKKNF